MSKPKLNLDAFAGDGSGHRVEAKPAPRAHQVTLDERIHEATRKGGRKAAFEGEETVKVALFLPLDLAAELKSRAARQSMTPSALVATWLKQ